MDRFLITLSLGPVQSLIGAARTTRDLWCGSWLLSEASRAAARVLHERQPGCLIFPCPENPTTYLSPRNEPGDAANIANILRAEVVLPKAAAARVLCEEAKAAAVSRLTELGDLARNKLGRFVREQVWQAQIDDILEGFASWVSIPADGDYTRASRRLGAALAARKATRDFKACRPLADKGLPKSSLDGALETVLPDDWPSGDLRRRKLRLSDGEQLDALGVMKRLVGNSDQFTAYPRIAADPWVVQLTPTQQDDLRTSYEPLVALELATRTMGNGQIYGAFPFDADLLYRFRLDNALASTSEDDNEQRALRDLQQCIDRISREQTTSGRQVGAPVPYAVILKADGDRMGALLSRADNADRARDISRALHDFASNVRRIVREYRGHAIYAGGDDVLALLPLAQARECSDKLARIFADSLHVIAKEMGIEAEDYPTLSVGLGIGHFMEPMGDLRARAERAERAAKGDTTETPRNALAVALGVRSGAEICWRAQWSDDPAFEALDQMIEAFKDGSLPSRVAYDLRAIDRRLAWLRGDVSDCADGMRSAEVGRMLDRARIRGGFKSIPDNLRDLIVRRTRTQSLKELAETLIIARWLSARVDSDLGEQA